MQLVNIASKSKSMMQKEEQKALEKLAEEKMKEADEIYEKKEEELKLLLDPVTNQKK